MQPRPLLVRNTPPREQDDHDRDRRHPEPARAKSAPGGRPAQCYRSQEDFPLRHAQETSSLPKPGSDTIGTIRRIPDRLRAFRLGVHLVHTTTANADVSPERESQGCSPHALRVHAMRLEGRKFAHPRHVNSKMIHGFSEVMRKGVNLSCLCFPPAVCHPDSLSYLPFRGDAANCRSVTNADTVDMGNWRSGVPGFLLGLPTRRPRVWARQMADGPKCKTPDATRPWANRQLRVLQQPCGYRRNGA